jgi:hypothetical protein
MVTAGVSIASARQAADAIAAAAVTAAAMKAIAAVAMRVVAAAIAVVAMRAVAVADDPAKVMARLLMVVVESAAVADMRLAAVDMPVVVDMVAVVNTANQ